MMNDIMIGWRTLIQYYDGINRGFGPSEREEYSNMFIKISVKYSHEIVTLNDSNNVIF